MSTVISNHDILNKRIRYFIDLGALVLLGSSFDNYGKTKDAEVKLFYIFPNKLYGDSSDKVYNIKKVARTRTEAYNRCLEEIIKHISTEISGNSLIKISDMMLDETITNFDTGCLWPDNGKIVMKYRLNGDFFTHNFDNNRTRFDELLQTIENELSDKKL